MRCTTSIGVADGRIDAAIRSLHFLRILLPRVFDLRGRSVSAVEDEAVPELQLLALLERRGAVGERLVRLGLPEIKDIPLS